MGGNLSEDSEQFKNLPPENQKWIHDCNEFERKYGKAAAAARDAISVGYYNRMYARAALGLDIEQSAAECCFDPTKTFFPPD